MNHRDKMAKTLNMDDVYTTVKQDFPEFRRQLEKLEDE